MPTASVDFTLAVVASIMIVTGAIYGVNMVAEPYLDSDPHTVERYNQIGRYILLSDGAPSDWGTWAQPTELGLASEGEAYELDIDKVTRLNPGNNYAVNYSVLWRALGIDDISFNLQVDLLFNVYLSLNSSEIQGGETLYRFNVTTERDGYPFSSFVRYYVVIDRYTSTEFESTDDGGKGTVDFSLPNSLTGTALLIGIAKIEESIMSYDVLPFAHNSGAPASGGAFASLSPIDYKLNVNLTSTSEASAAIFSYNYSSPSEAVDVLTESDAGSLHEEVTVSSLQSTTSTSWTDVPGASVSFTPGSSSEEWMIFVTADIRSDSTFEDDTRFRYDISGTSRGETGVQQGTTSTTPIDPYNVYYHFTRVTGVTSRQTVTFQYQASSGYTAYARNVHILCIRLDWADLEYVEVNGDTFIAGAQTLATLQFTPSTAGDYIVAYCTLVSEQPVGGSGAMTWLDYDFGTSLAPDAWTTPNTMRIQTDRDQYEPHGLFGMYTLDTSQHTFRVQAGLIAAEGSTARDVRIIAFRTDAFDSLESDEDTTVSSTNSANIVRSTVITVDPGEERDYLVLAGIHTISSGTSSREAGGVEIDDTFVQRKGDQRLTYVDIARIASHYVYVHNTSNSFKVEATYGRGGVGTDTIYSKQSVVFVLKIPEYVDYVLDLEVQWTDITDLTGADLAVYAYSQTGSEDLQVECWDEGNSQWVTLGDVDPYSWNNFTISPYLTSTTFTARFAGKDESDDTVQDSWSIDASLIRLDVDGSGDFVDTDASDVDSSPDKGTHSNFPAQTHGPDAFQLGQTSWLLGWGNRVRITIDHDDVDSDLTNFPVLIYISVSSGWNADNVSYIFDELQSDANRMKIAVTEDDGTSQCYVEIERWNDADEEAWLWGRVPSVSSTTDTILYLYFDSSQPDNSNYIGDSETTPAQNVWDSSFDGVYHLQGDPEVPANWGKMSVGGMSTTASHSRTMGGTSPDIANMTIGSISIYLGAQTGDVRLAVYTGGTLDNPTSATLLWDAGIVNSNGVEGWYSIEHPSGGVSLPANTVTWLAWKRDTGVAVYYDDATGDPGDFQVARGRNDNSFNEDPSVAYPATYGEVGSFADFWYSIYLSVDTPDMPLVDSTTNRNDPIPDGAMTSTDQVSGQIDGSYAFDGTDDYLYTLDSFDNPQEFTVEAWFSTTSPSGTKIVGLEDLQTGESSTSWDRHIYVGTDGRAYFGCYSGSTDVAISDSALNNGEWHYVVGVRNDATNNLYIYVDGELNDTTANPFAEDFVGFWRIGGYTTVAWPNAVDGYFPGTIDEVRVSDGMRSAAWVRASFESGVDELINFGSFETWADYEGVNYSIPRLIDGSPIICVLTGVSGSDYWAEWVPYPQVPLETGADMSDDSLVSDVYRTSYIVEVNDVLYRFTMEFRSPREND